MIPRSKISTRRHERRSAVASNFTAFSRSVSILARQSSRARRADDPELRHLFRVRGSRWRSPSRSRLVVGTTQPRRSRSASLPRRAERRRSGDEKTKKKLCFFDFLQMRSSRRSRRRETKEFRRRSVSESLLPTREGSSDGYSRRREGRSVLDPTTSRAARMMIISSSSRDEAFQSREARHSSRLSRHRRLFRVSSVCLRW